MPRDIPTGSCRRRCLRPPLPALRPRSNPAAARRTEVSVASIRIQDGTLGYRDDRTNKVTTLGLPRLEATATSPDSPLHLDADATFNGTAFNLAGDTGSLTRLQEPTATTPWPVKLMLTVGTAKLSADGALTQPQLGQRLRPGGERHSTRRHVPDPAAARLRSAAAA